MLFQKLFLTVLVVIVQAFFAVKLGGAVAKDTGRYPWGIFTVTSSIILFPLYLLWAA